MNEIPTRELMLIIAAAYCLAFTTLWGVVVVWAYWRRWKDDQRIALEVAQWEEEERQWEAKQAKLEDPE